MESTVVLFTERDSIYKSLDCICYDIERNALTCTSTEPCIYHPPCRSWGRLYKRCNFVAGEHKLAIWSILRIWKYGGVLEHPAGSKLWKTMQLPLPGQRYDAHGGFSLSIDQFWFGHKCKKNTWLYIKGTSLYDIPDIPLNLDCILYCMESSYKNSLLHSISKNERSSTPLQLAVWLCDLCSLIKKHVI